MKKGDLNSKNMPEQNKLLFDLVNEKAGGNVSSFASMIGVSQQSLDRVFKADPRSGKFPSISNAIKEGLKEKLGIDEIYLLTGGKVEEIREDTPEISYIKGKPYYDVDFLGGFDIIVNDQTINPEYLIDFKKYNDADCWCNITGHSMEPLISHGDIIAIKEMKEWREFILFGELYGIITNDMRTVKIVTRSTLGNEFLQLVPVNKSGEYQPQDIPVKLITHVFKILGCMKKL